MRLVDERPGAFRFRAGQFAWFTLDRSPFSVVEHPFSIASAPADLPNLELVIKEAGDFTSRLDRLRVGGRAHLDGPHGNFTLEGRTADGLVVIAGGVGIAPMFSLLRQAAAERDPRPWLLLYGNRHAGQIVHGAELDSLHGRLDFEVVHLLGEPPPGWAGEVGQFDRAFLARHVRLPQMAGRLFFVCGPPAMIDTVERALVELGVPLGRIVAERFRYDWACGAGGTEPCTITACSSPTAASRSSCSRPHSPSPSVRRCREPGPSAFLPLEGRQKGPGRGAQRFAVCLVERRPAGDRRGDVGQDLGEEVMVEVDLGPPLVLARAREPDRHARLVGRRLERGRPTEAPHVGFVREVDGDLGAVGDRLQGHAGDSRLRARGR